MSLSPLKIGMKRIIYEVLMGSNISPSKEDLKKYVRPFLTWCEGVYDYVLHIHWASVLHGDLRMSYCGDSKFMIGVTLFLYKPGSVKVRPNGLEGWTDFLKVVRDPRNFKLNFETGEIQGQRSLAATVKLKEPIQWMKVRKYISPPGRVGARALRKWWSYMTVVDRGKVEHLTRKLDEFEFYFSKGKTFRGRYILRPFGRNFTFFTASAEQPVVVGTQAKKLREGKEISGFLWIKAKNQCPYVLGPRAIRKKFIPPQGFSGLPRELKKRIPSEFQYWKTSSEDTRRKVRDELVLTLKKQKQYSFLEAGNWSKVKL